MADNVPITAGSGTTIATDDVAGVHYQIVKIGDATPDSTNKAIVNASGEILVKISTATATVPVSAASNIPVNIAASGISVPTAEVRSTTATRSTVAASATSVTLLAVDATRKSSTIHNDSTATLYVGCGTVAASLTSFTYKVAPDGFVEIEYGYTGEIRGIWSSATGNARITVFT